MEISRTVTGLFPSRWLGSVSVLDWSLGLIHRLYQHHSQAWARSTSCLSWCLRPFLTSSQRHRD